MADIQAKCHQQKDQTQPQCLYLAGNIGTATNNGISPSCSCTAQGDKVNTASVVIVAFYHSVMDRNASSSALALTQRTGFVLFVVDLAKEPR